MGIGGDAASVVVHLQHVGLFQIQLDAAGVAGHRLVHGIVDDLGGQVVQRVCVGAADIHARAPAHRLQPLKHFDILGGIGARGGGGAVEQVGIGLGHG